MRSPFSPLELLAFVFILALLVIFIQVGAITIAFEKLGIAPSAAFFLLFGSLFGSAVNIPLFTIDSDPPMERLGSMPPRGMLRVPQMPFHGKTIVAINVGGCLVPLGFSLYLVGMHSVPVLQATIGIAVVAIVSHFSSRPVPGMGVAMPVLVAPLTAAATALIIDIDQSAPLAYVAGTLGVLIGADLLRLGDIRKLGTPFASIGGAGTFDGIFITGIVAVLLA